MPGAGVGLGVDGDGGDPEALGRAHDAAGDLAPVRYEQLMQKAKEFSQCRRSPKNQGVGARFGVIVAIVATSRINSTLDLLHIHKTSIYTAC